MKYLSLVARILLGLVFLIFGLNKFYMFIHAQMPTGLALEFYMVLIRLHMIYFIATLEVIGGILLLANKFVALALTLLGPIIVNIFLYSALMDTNGLPIAAAVVVLYVIVLRYHKAAFEPLLRMKS